MPRPSADAVARSRQLAAAFTAQVQMTMLQSLSTLGSDGEDGAGEGDDGELGAGGGGDLSFGSGLDQMQLMASLFAGAQERGTSPATLQAQLAALGGSSDAGTGFGGGLEGLAGAGAGAEAQLAQQLLASLGGVDAAGGVASVGAPAASADARTNARIVAQVARAQGVDPEVAVAMMLVESGGRASAVGDGGTSFGLFQLHDGGMLTAAGLTPQQAFDPRTNATVALRAYAHEHAKGSDRRTPGEIAAASQRPADPVGYARKVDAALDRARALLASG